jgi:hypothetical protein
MNSVSGSDVESGNVGGSFDQETIQPRLQQLEHAVQQLNASVSQALGTRQPLSVRREVEKEQSLSSADNAVDTRPQPESFMHHTMTLDLRHESPVDIREASSSSPYPSQKKIYSEISSQPNNVVKRSRDGSIGVRPSGFHIPSRSAGYANIARKCLLKQDSASQSYLGLIYDLQVSLRMLRLASHSSRFRRMTY